jgi:hypothetical protein
MARGVLRSERFMLAHSVALFVIGLDDCLVVTSSLSARISLRCQRFWNANLPGGTSTDWIFGSYDPKTVKAFGNCF